MASVLIIHCQLQNSLFYHEHKNSLQTKVETKRHYKYFKRLIPCNKTKTFEAAHRNHKVACQSKIQSFKVISVPVTYIAPMHFPEGRPAKVFTAHDSYLIFDIPTLL